MMLAKNEPPLILRSPIQTSGSPRYDDLLLSILPDLSAALLQRAPGSTLSRERAYLLIKICPLSTIGKNFPSTAKLATVLRVKYSTEPLWTQENFVRYPGLFKSCSTDASDQYSKGPSSNSASGNPCHSGMGRKEALRLILFAC